MRVKIFFISLLSLAMALSFMSCEGEMGPAGPAGPAGPEGPAGADGKNGAENCIDCHGNNQLITAKMFQLEVSTHQSGGQFVRNYSSCATCHTSQGFLERVETGITAVSSPVPDPLPINCYTCHMIHDTYTDADWNLTTSSPVTFWVGEETADLGNSNLCLNCHQARPPNPDLPMVGETGTVSLTNFRFGPHHGSQGVMLTGNSAYEVPGDTPYENSNHTNLASCTDCHMASVADGRAAGGHTFNVSYESRGREVINAAGCAPCHTPEEVAVIVPETQTEIDALLTALGARLNELGILDDDFEYANASSDEPLELTTEQLGILWNYQYVREDNSFGVHNYKYAKALLENSIAALD